MKGELDPSRALPPWRDVLERSLELNQATPHHQFVQLATLGLDGAPRVRTLVARGFDLQHSLMLCTDLLSAKVKELRVEHKVELCWYFTESREQYRLRGELEQVTGAHERSALWRTLSAATQAQFSWPTPELPLSVDDSCVHQRAEQVRVDQNVNPPDRFTLWRLQATRVDHLQLGPPARRVIYERVDLEWHVTPVNP